MTAPDCTNKGYTTYTCERDGCGHSYKDDHTDALGHDYKVTVTPPTCTEGGYTTSVCNRCGDTVVSDEKAPLGHTHGDPATCETDEICTVCNTVLVKAIGHKLGPDATCTEPQKCITCGKELNTATGHIEGRPATCVDPQICISCGIVLVPATGVHTSSGAATCTSNETCTVCNKVLTYALGHDWDGNFAISIKPTCTTKGEEKRTCKRCDLVEKRDVDPLGHDYDAVVTAPTCTAKGYTTHTCKRVGCTASYIDSYKEPLGHDYSGKGTVVTAPTCTEKGYTTYTCQRSGCNESHKDKYTDPNGHSFESWKTVKAPTCTADGLERRLCKNCDHKEENVLSMLGHDYKDTVTAPTCLTDGYTTHVCRRCSNRYTDAVTKALGHDLNITVTAPTCLEGGFTHRECKRCDYKDDIDHKAALGHSYGSWTVVTEAEFEKEGLKKRECTRCHDVETSVIPATLDKTPPTGVIKIDGKSYTTLPNNPGFNTHFNRKFTVALTSADTESGVESMQYYVSYSPLTAEKLDAIGEWTECPNTMSHSFEIYTEGEFIVYVRLTDRSANKAYIGSDGVVLDETAPTVSGIKHNGNYCKNVTVTVSDKYLSTVYYNGVSQRVSNGKCTFTVTANDNSAQRITATDKAGNKVEYSIRVFSNHKGGSVATCTTAQICTQCGEQVKAALGHSYDAGVVTKEPTALAEGVRTFTCTRCGNKKTESIPKLSVDMTIASTTYFVSNDETISMITVGTTVGTLLSKFDNQKYLSLYTAGGQKITNMSMPVATGMVLKLESGVTLDKATLIVDGDVNGDGEVDIMDALDIQSHQLRIANSTLLDVYFKAADVSIDNSNAVDIMDYVTVMSHILGAYTIKGQKH